MLENRSVKEIISFEAIEYNSLLVTEILKSDDNKKIVNKKHC